MHPQLLHPMAQSQIDDLRRAARARQIITGAAPQPRRSLGRSRGVRRHLLSPRWALHA